MKKPKRIIGAKIMTLRDIRNKGGVVINKGEICTIIHSYRGYSIETIDKRQINRVDGWDIKFLEL